MKRLALAAALALTTMALQAAAERPARKAKPPAVGSGVVLTLAEGRQVTGLYLGRRDGAVWIGLDGGEIGVEESTILAIKPVKSAHAEYNRRKAKLSPTDADGWWKLAAWARDKKLEDPARVAAETVVRLDPHHEEAHKLLGHVKLGERWADFEESQRRKGMVKFEGEWRKENEVREIKAERAKSPGIRPSGDHRGEGGQTSGN